MLLAGDIRWRLFAGSYAPLLVMLALRFDGNVLWVSVGAAGAVFLADTARLVLWQPRHVAPSPYRVTEVRDHGSQVAGYLATYLLPLLVVPMPSFGDLLPMTSPPNLAQKCLPARAA
jgi:hypothetical protein